MGNGILSGSISNSVGRVSTTKSGGGTWTFSGTNSYSGDTTIGGGTLKIGSVRALGFGGTQTSSTGVTTVNSGATLDLNGITAINEPIVLNGTGVGGNGVLVNNSVTAASIGNGVAGLAVAATGSGAGFSSAPSVVISGTGSGATATASLGITTATIDSATGGTGWVTGDTVSVYGGGGSSAVGTVTASGGAIASVTITSAGRGFTSAPTTITKLFSAAGSGGTITGNATNFTVGGLTTTNSGTGYTGTPTVTIGGSAAAVTPALSSVNLATDSSIGGSGNMTVNSVVSGAGLTKVGAGTVTLSGANTYTGNTTVRAGTLKLDGIGSIGSSANIIVGDSGSSGTHLDVTTKTGGLTIGLGQTLKGIGQIDGNTMILGIHAPGSSPGLQTFNGNLAYSAGSMLNWDLASNVSTDTGGVRGVFFDAMDVLSPGTLSIAGGVTSNLIFNGTGSTVDFANPFWTSNHQWKIHSDTLAPTLSSAAIFDTVNVSPDSLGATFASGAFTWSNVGADVFLNFTAASVPEPGVGVLTLIGLLGVSTRMRRRNARRSML